MSDKPDPGSPEALLAGCTCPVMDNNNGNGMGEEREIYTVDALCPIHGA